MPDASENAVPITEQEVFPNVVMPQYREEDVLARLLDESERFKRFYDEGRTQIRYPIAWLMDEELPPNVHCRATSLPNGSYRMRVESVPLAPECDYEAAHELEHIAVSARSFPRATALPPFESACAALNNMLHDTLVNPVLQDYGFSPVQKLRNELQHECDRIKNYNSKPDRVGRLEWVFNCARQLLQGKILADSQPVNEQYSRLFAKKFPDILQEAEDIVRVIDEKGCDTPEKMDCAYRCIIDLYGMENAVSAVRAEN